MDKLGDRQKMYEGYESDRRFMPLLPICARLDGKNFSKFTKGLDRPYDKQFSSLMVETTRFLVEETCACIGYTQSDEISLIYYSSDIKSQVFFDGRIQKMTSVLAAMCSIKFYTELQKLNQEDKWSEKAKKMPVFDCRVWTVPTKEEACNVLIWRELDATKNAITMASQEYYSDKELFKKNGNEKQELLFQKGINFNDYPNFFKRGTYIQRRRVDKKFTTEEIENLPLKHEARLNPDLMVNRAEFIILDLPPITKIINRQGVVFDGENPEIINE